MRFRTPRGSRGRGAPRGPARRGAGAAWIDRRRGQGRAGRRHRRRHRPARWRPLSRRRARWCTAPPSSAVTDANGTYRFPSLAPGRYEITANLSGFAPAKVQNIDLRLGQLLNITFTLSPGGRDRDRPGRGRVAAHRHQAERARHLDPRGRHRQDAQGPRLRVARHPGPRRQHGDQVRPARSRSTARPAVRTAASSTAPRPTNIQTGAQGKPMVTDFVEEVQVKSSGYAAEYGGSTGGVINVLSKSGTNQWRGDAFAVLLESDAPRLRLRARRCASSRRTTARPSTSRTRRTRTTARSRASTSAGRSSATSSGSSRATSRSSGRSTAPSPSGPTARPSTFREDFKRELPHRQRHRPARAAVADPRRRTT